MRGIVAAVGLGASLLSATAGAQVVQLDFERQSHPGRRVNRRASSSSVEAAISNRQENGGYFASVAIGSPGQPMSLQLDTGSSDVWVPWVNAEACQPSLAQNSKGCSLGSFNPTDSDSFEDTGKGEFTIQYVDKSGAKGDYFEDHFQMGGVTIKNLTMGIALDTDINYGLVGVGYASNEAATETDYNQYPNLPIAMRDAGFIKTIAYSLWLNDLGASKGSLLFGGIDTEKYKGDLKALDIIPQSNGKYYHFSVPVTGLKGVSSSGTDTVRSDALPLTAILDSGTTLTYLPTDMAETVWKEVGAVYLAEAESALLPCSFANHEGYFSFEFGGSDGAHINVTMDELVLDGAGFDFPRGYPYSGQPACVFGIQNQTNSKDDPDAPYLLGDTFLRSAYVVYDLVNNQVAIAPTEFNATKSNVVSFPSMGATIPSSTTVANQNSTSDDSSGSQGDLTASDGFQSAASSLVGFSVMAWAVFAVSTAIVL